jgi:YhcN/YlaJ family sporulation lipoprotein
VEKLNKNKILLSTIILLIAVFVIGCTVQPNNRAQTRLGVDREDLGMRRNNMRNMDRINDNIMRDLDDNDMIDNDVNNLDDDINNNRVMRNNNFNNVSRKAEQIAEKIERLNNIDEAYVLISGNTAIVGVDMDRNVQGQITNDLKARIENIVKDTANNIKNVSVTADPDLLTRIEKMAEDIANGRPITGFAEQFQEILRRIAPTR